MDALLEVEDGHVQELKTPERPSHNEESSYESYLQVFYQALTVSSAQNLHLFLTVRGAKKHPEICQNCFLFCFLNKACPQEKILYQSLTHWDFTAYDLTGGRDYKTYSLSYPVEVEGAKQQIKKPETTVMFIVQAHKLTRRLKQNHRSTDHFFLHTSSPYNYRFIYYSYFSSQLLTNICKAYKKLKP